ncbi:uncharacterized protein LOC121376973 [Gigantopelta aegis]|uniref:uncharacterized protein LOC121376973 n=1 Tax=Gigantopelta aegis TaxID=1735272 RepID=UPI001B88C176|nr:uncharacterized protein LOC121376973 [Gigantopelta aegis]
MSNDQDGNIAEIDFSVIRTAIEIGGKPIEQVLNGVHYGSPEVRCLLLDECELIIECKVCRALFRALPLFVAHKRVYCTKSFQESQPPLFDTIITDETVVVEPTAPEDDDDDDSSTRTQAAEAATPEDQLNQLVEQIQAGKAGTSEEYKFYSNVAGMVERRKELGKTMNLELKTIPTNRNAVMVNFTEAVPPDESVNGDNDDEMVTEPEVKGPSKLETVLTQKILPKCRNESVIKSKCDDTVKNSSTGNKTKIPDSEAIDVTALSGTKNKESVVLVSAGMKSNDKDTESAVTGKPPESEMLKSVAKQPSAASRVSVREKKPSLKSRVSELAEADETLDLSSLKCLKCHMSYSSKKTLLYHYQMRHSQLRTFFPCPYCSNIFFYFWGLTRHMMKIHKKSKNQIDKMREKLRKRSFTKCITKSCNIAKDQLQFIADDEDVDDSLIMMEKSPSEAAPTSKPANQQTPSNPSAKSTSSSKAKVGGAEKNVKASYVNEYQTPKVHREPRISLKEGLRNSKEKQDDSRKAIIKRMSESPRSRNPSWAEIADTKSRRLRKSDSPKSISDEEPSPKSKERALDELQKKLTEAAAVPVATRSASNERLQSESRSSSTDWKNETAAVVRGSETKTPPENPEARRKPAEAAAVSSAQVTERRPIVSGSLQGQEKTRLSSESSSPGMDKKRVSSESSPSAKKDDVILVSGHPEPAKLTVDRPGARRRQIQIGTTVVPRMISEKPLSSENKDVIDKQKDLTGGQLVSSKAKTTDISVLDVQGGSSEGRSVVQQKTVEEITQSTQPLSDRDSDEIRSRSTRRRTLTTKALASASESYRKNEVNERKNEKNDKQSDKNAKHENKVVDKKEKPENKVLSENKVAEKNDKQDKHVEKDVKQSEKTGIEDSKKVCKNDKESKIEKDVKQSEKTRNEDAKKVCKNDKESKIEKDVKQSEKTRNEDAKKVCKNDKESKIEKDVKQSEKTRNEDAKKVCKNDKESRIDKTNNEEQNSGSVKPINVKKSVSMDKTLNDSDSSDMKSSVSPGKDRQGRSSDRSHLHDDHPSASGGGDEAEFKAFSKCDNVDESELSEKMSSSRSSSVERIQRSKDSSTEMKICPKDAKLVDLKDVGETTMRLFASPPGSKPLIKHSRIKKMNEFVVRCVPQTAASTAAKSLDAKTEPHSREESCGKESEEQNNVPEKADIADSTTKDDGVASDLNSGREGSTVDLSSECDKNDNAADSLNGDDDCSVISSDDNAKCSTETSTPRVRTFRCGCSRTFSCKVGFANHRRACKVDGSDVLEISSEVDDKTDDTDDSCSVASLKVDDTSEKKNLFVCHCGKEFNVKVSLSNHQRACINQDAKNLPETEARRVQKVSAKTDSNSGDGKDNVAKSIFSMQNSFELFSCDKCNRVFGRKVSFINHQKNCTEKKPDKGDQSARLSNKNCNASAVKKDTPLKTSSTRRKFVARKLSAFRNDAVDSDDDHSTQKCSSSDRNNSAERRVKPNEYPVSYLLPHRKRSNSVRSEIDGDCNSPPEKQVRIIEEIWVDKLPGKPVERVKSNRIYVMEAEGTGKLHCQDTKKLCDIADEAAMKCLVCLQEFTSVSNLRRHAIRHLGWKRYKCKMCRFSSYNKSECNTHIIRTHSEKLRSAAATEYMIVDLNKEACRVRTQKKKQTLSERKATEMDRSSEGRQQSHSRPRRQEKLAVRVPEDRKKPAIREENIRNPIAHNTFNISTRNSPRKFDTRPYRKVDQMSTLCTRKSYYLKANQRVEGNQNKKRSGSLNNSATAETTSVVEKMDELSPKQKKGTSATCRESVDGKLDNKDESSPKQKKGSSSACRENIDGKMDNNVEKMSNVAEEKGDSAAGEKVDKMDDLETTSDTESFSRSKGRLSRKHGLSSELKDMGYASDSCLASHQSPSRSHTKTKSVSSESSAQKHRKLSGGSSSSEKSSTPHGAGSRPVTMMSIQDMFELIKPKPRPERKSVGDPPAKSGAVKTTCNRNNDAVVRRVSLEGAVMTRQQADSVSQAGDKDRTGIVVKETSSKGDNPASSDAPEKTGSSDAAEKTASTAVRNLNKELVKDA